VHCHSRRSHIHDWRSGETFHCRTTEEANPYGKARCPGVSLGVAVGSHRSYIGQGLDLRRALYPQFWPRSTCRTGD